MYAGLASRKSSHPTDHMSVLTFDGMFASNLLVLLSYGPVALLCLVL